MSKKSSEVGLGVVLGVVLLLFAAPVVGLVLLGVTMYLLRAQAPARPVYSTAVMRTGTMAYPTPIPTTAVAPAQIASAARTAEMIIAADNSLTLNGQPIDEEQLPSELQRLLQVDATPVTVNVMADPDASGETVIRVLTAMIDASVPYTINPGALPPDSELPAVFHPSGSASFAMPGLPPSGAAPALPSSSPASDEAAN